jgi:LmbE family N-acetylglucosaminyl deacetylase
VAELLTAALGRRASPLEDEALAQSAIVFSPHFDDETLGCGGTILRKRALGADVSVVFLTDGRASHRDWVDEAELARMRAQEGLAAAGALGVDEGHVHRLGFEETRLRSHAEAATARVREILGSIAPEQIFVPYRFEPPRDHAATFEIVSRAISSHQRPVTVFEYPIWVWAQWPWTALPDGSPGQLLRLLIRQGRTLRRFARDFRFKVETRGLGTSKDQALAQHRSQVFRPPDQPTWPVLGDVHEGDFLACFCRDFELFARSTPA